MKTIKFAAYLFYRYYSTGPTRDIPYFSTLCAMATLTFLHLMQILLLTNLYYAIGQNNSNNRWEGYLSFALVAIPIFLFLKWLTREKELNKLSYSSGQIKRGNVLLIVYIIATIALLIFIVEIKRK